MADQADTASTPLTIAPIPEQGWSCHSAVRTSARTLTATGARTSSPCPRTISGEAKRREAPDRSAMSTFLPAMTSARRATTTRTSSTSRRALMIGWTTSRARGWTTSSLTPPRSQSAPAPPRRQRQTARHQRHRSGRRLDRLDDRGSPWINDTLQRPAREFRHVMPGCQLALA